MLRHVQCHTDYSSLVSPLKGTITIRCNKCSVIHLMTENFTEILIPCSRTIKSSLNLYFQVKKLQDYICDGCNNFDTTSRRLKLTSVPSTLCILLNRYSDNMEKNMWSVIISQLLDLSKYHVPSTDNVSMRYQLSAITCHVGNDDRTLLRSH